MKRRMTFIAVLLLMVEPCWAQTSSQGTIYGTVTDPSGAVIPGAQLTVVNEATALTRNATTNLQGDYRVDFLPPGKYRVEIQKEGFDTANLTGTTLLVGQALRVDAALRVGVSTQVVTITSTAPTLNTTSASHGAVIENNEIQNLPLNGREFLALAGLVPGVFTGTRTYDNPVPAKGNYVVGYNGARGSYNSFYMDGGQNTAPNFNNMISSPSIDAIQEFRIETDQYSARYGQAGGAVISIVTKSGTNAYHGSLYEYHRDKALDALPFFYRGARRDLPNYLRNQFGGAIGGPIRKDKLFFFANAEFFPQRGSQQKITFAPTAAERIGDVRNSINPWDGQPTVLMHPYTGEVIPSGILPDNLKTPLGEKLMSLWPEPNYPQNPAFNYRVFRPTSNSVRKYLGRIDANFSSRDSISGTFNYGNYDTGAPGYIDNGDKVLSQHDRSVTARYTRSFTPTLVSVTGFTFSQYFYGDHFRLDDKNYGAALGMDPSVNAGKGMPFIMLFTQGSQFFTFGNQGDNKNFTRQGQLYEDLSWQKGRHTLQIGGMFWRQKYNWQFFSGHAQYLVNLIDGLGGSSLWFLFGVTGSGFTNLLAGLYNLGVFGAGGGEYTHFQRDTYGLYLQDTWKVTPRLMLNLGVRWDYERPFRVLDGKYMSLNPQTGLIRYAKGAPGIGAMQIPYETDGPDLAYQAHPRAFAPRFGFAWQPFQSNRTVVRGGYGIFHTSEPASIMQPASFANPFGGPTVQWMKGILGGWPEGKDHLTPMSEPPYGLDFTRTHSPGCCFVYTAPDFPRSYMQQWNLTVGHNFAKDVVGEVAYVGSRGINLPGYIPLESYNYSAFTLFHANYGFGVNPPFYIKGFGSNYNALQMSARRNTGHGLTLLAAYTWAHNLADASNTATFETLGVRLEQGVPIYRRFQGNAGFDVRHRLSVASVYELPFGRGRKLGTNWNRFTDSTLGGWNLNLIYTAQSGFPWNVWTPSNLFADRTCNGNLPKSERTIARWFDYTCFPTHIDPIKGQPSPGNAGSNVIYGPGLNNWDMGIHKVINLGESKSFEIRLEGFNVWNHPQLNGPATVTWLNNTKEGAEIVTAKDQREFQLALRFRF